MWCGDGEVRSIRLFCFFYRARASRDVGKVFVAERVVIDGLKYNKNGSRKKCV